MAGPSALPFSAPPALDGALLELPYQVDPEHVRKLVQVAAAQLVAGKEAPALNFLPQTSETVRESVGNEVY